MAPNPLDEAEQFAHRVRGGQSQREVARSLGCSQSHVSKRLSLLWLHPDIQAAVVTGELDVGDAVRIAMVSSPETQLAMFAAIQTRRTALYRHFDEEGNLLYVGISGRIGKRTDEHSKTAEWVRYVSRSEAVWFDTKVAAKAAESVAIRDEWPVFNRCEANPESGTLRDAYVAAHEWRRDLRILLQELAPQHGDAVGSTRY